MVDTWIVEKIEELRKNITALRESRVIVVLCISVLSATCLVTYLLPHVAVMFLSLYLTHCNVMLRYRDATTLLNNHIPDQQQQLV
jgi:hypothetical protein